MELDDDEDDADLIARVARISGRVDFTMEQKDEFNEVFLNFADDDEVMDLTSLGVLLEALGEDISDGQLKDLIHDLDSDGSGLVSSDEFIELMRKRLLVSPVGNADIRSSFDLLDKDGSGFVDKEEITNVVVDFCKKLTTDEVAELIRWCDINEDGQLDFAEFSKIMNQMTVAEKQQLRFIEEASLVDE